MAKTDKHASSAVFASGSVRMNSNVYRINCDLPGGGQRFGVGVLHRSGAVAKIAIGSNPPKTTPSESDVGSYGRNRPRVDQNGVAHLRVGTTALGGAHRVDTFDVNVSVDAVSRRQQQ